MQQCLGLRTSRGSRSAYNNRLHPVGCVSSFGARTFAISTHARMVSGCSPSFISSLSKSVIASAVAPAKPAITPSLSLRTLRALGLITCEPSVVDAVFPLRRAAFNRREVRGGALWLHAFWFPLFGTVILFPRVSVSLLLDEREFTWEPSVTCPSPMTNCARTRTRTHRARVSVEGTGRIQRVVWVVRMVRELRVVRVERVMRVR
eukprot:3926949-Pleurochrysis_carterae.AAC.1